MIANANIDKLIITLTIVRTPVVTHAQVQNLKTQNQMLPDDHSFLLLSFPMNSRNLAMDKYGVMLLCLVPRRRKGVLQATGDAGFESRETKDQRESTAKYGKAG